MRQSRHDNIRAEQLACDKLDGKQDWVLRAGANESINLQVTDALLRKPNEFRNSIEENDRQLPLNNDKVRYLKYVSDVLRSFRTGVRAKEISAAELPLLLSSFEKIMTAEIDSQPAVSLLRGMPYGIAKINAQIFFEGDEATAANAIIYSKYAELHPDKVLSSIAPYASEPYADSLIVLACKINPVQFYSYAQSPNSVVGKLIHRSKDPMVMQVAELSRTDNALFYFPFLDDLLSGRQSIDSIKKYVGNGEAGYDSVGYYKLLVRTAIAYSRRMAAPLRDTPTAYYGANGFYETLARKARIHFVAPINALHEQNKSLDKNARHSAAKPGRTVLYDGDE